MMMRPPFVSAWILLFPYAAHAMYEEDVGKFDFLLSSTGHGAVEQLHIANDRLITAQGSSCFVAARKIKNGELLWRKNVCGKRKEETNNMQSVLLEGMFVTLAQENSNALLQGWRPSDGALVWQRRFPSVIEMSASGDSNLSLMTQENEALLIDGVTGIHLEGVAPEPTSKSSGLPEGSTLECESSGISMKVEDDAVAVTSSTGKVLATLPGDRFWVVQCTAQSTRILTASGLYGTTSFRSFPQGPKWTAEEGLGHVSAGLILDAPNLEVLADRPAHLLSFPARLESQWKSIASTFSMDHRNHIFGFGKIAVILSSKYNRVWGLDTLTAGEPRYQIDLSVEELGAAKWHRLVHGSVNDSISSSTASHHSRDIVALSYFDKTASMHWQCWDGTTGVSKGKGAVAIADHGSIEQVVPMASAHDAVCRQGALLVMKDGSILPINAAAKGKSLADGRTLYSHKIDAAASRLQTFAVEDTTRLVGTALFPGESIVTAAYPPREQVVQSPCTVLGDNSLLLKYLNPHLMVVVTTAEPSDDDEDFLHPKPLTKKPRKPLGVTPPEVFPPNLFINLVDTVAGRVLYRASHAHAQAPVVVTLSENWVFYSFTNMKTHKAELGVLSLYEGKIVKDGLTAFTSPEQSTAFSSLDAPEPIVLAKTYVLPQAATALGVTATKGGISGRRLIVAGLNGRIDAIDRKLLEPRRPLGKLKDDEKKEGLTQYHEIIPMVPPMALSYNLTVEGVTTILSAPTDLESQSLVLAFGGPDIFFVRTSPSRGFDLLPDSFNKALISLVVVAMAVIYLVLQRVVAKKVINEGWV